jgi:NitT/TauT family transport system permease protein
VAEAGAGGARGGRSPGGGPPGGAREQALLAREAERARQAARARRRRILGGQALLLALLLVGWALASGRLVDRLFLSDPVSVARAFWIVLANGTLWFHLRFTLTEMLLGYLIGAGLGLGGALAVALVPAGEPILRPFVLLAWATPKIALAPLMIIWFGIGVLPKVVLAATFVFFVVFLSTLAGLATVSPDLVAVVRVMGASPLTVFRKVAVPAAMPFIVTALRITIPAALIGAIIGEFISANRGIGYLINAASSRYNTAEVFAGLASLLVVVLLMNAAVSAFERAWLRWAPREGAALW